MTTKETAPHGRGMAWATLLVSGGISLGVNLWHAFDQAPHGHVTWWFAALAVMYGAAPVVLAAFQAHSAAFTPKGWFRLALTYLLMLLGMALSIRAQAAAVEPFAGKGWRWVFPVMVDLSTIEALITLVISARSRARGPVVRGEPLASAESAVPDQAPVREPVWDDEPVPVRAGEPLVVPAGLAEPLKRSVPDVPAAPVPAAPVQTGGPDRGVPADRTAPVPADQTAPDRPGTADLTSAKAGDTAALKEMDRVFAAQDPTTVSVRQVRKELGAGHARADRLLAVWTARTAGSDRGSDGAGAQTGTGADEADREGGTDGEGEPDRTADRVPA